MSLAMTSEAVCALPGGYELHRVVDKGCFAVVYEGRDPEGRQVAIKVLDSEHPQAEPRFRREIMVTRELPESPNVVRFRGEGKTERGVPFLAMEYVDGFTLERMLRKGRRLAEQPACELMGQVCDALGALHALGVTHGDIKPANIMLTTRGLAVKLIDFGLVRDAQGLLRFFEEEGLLLSHEFFEDLDTGMLMGTPDYIAPEQISDARVTSPSEARTDTPADVFGLGAILYQLMTGKRPWPFEPTATSPTEYKAQVRAYLEARLAVDSVDLARPDCINPVLWTIVAKSLQRDPKLRQGDARVLATDIRRYLNKGAGVPTNLDMAVTLPGAFIADLVEDGPEPFDLVVPERGRAGTRNEHPEAEPADGPEPLPAGAPPAEVVEPAAADAVAEAHPEPEESPPAAVAPPPEPRAEASDTVLTSIALLAIAAIVFALLSTI